MVERRSAAPAATPPSSPTAIQPSTLTAPTGPSAAAVPPAVPRAAGRREPAATVAARSRAASPSSPAVDQLVELQLQGREGGQGAADAGASKRVGRLSSGWSRQQREEEAERQRAGQVDGEGRPGPGPGRGRKRLRQPDPDQRPGDTAGVDRRQLAARVALDRHLQVQPAKAAMPTRAETTMPNIGDAAIDDGLVERVERALIQEPDGPSLSSASRSSVGVQAAISWRSSFPCARSRGGRRGLLVHPVEAVCHPIVDARTRSLRSSRRSSVQLSRVIVCMRLP